MDKRLIIATALALALTGCASFPVGNLCSAGPVILDRGADNRLTRSEKEQIVTLNESGEAICGWQAPN